ncbi:MAG: hypothetical protein ABSD58_12980 [Verrucomicrobiia bacterium]|jgi:hypothetical protein
MNKPVDRTSDGLPATRARSGVMAGGAALSPTSFIILKSGVNRGLTALRISSY